jgi:cyanophycin synthetase
MRVLAHLANGEMGGLIDGLEPDAEDRAQGRLVVRRGDANLLDMSLADIPITWGGAAWFNVANALQAACAALASGIAAADVERGLRTFKADFARVSGRLNRATIDGRDVILDYAHNPAALQALSEVVHRVRGGRRVLGVMSVPGDRRDEDKVTCGQIASRMFDELVVCEPNLRGRPPRETAERIAAAAGVPWTYVEDEVGAAREAMRRSSETDLVVMCVDHVKPVYDALTAKRADLEDR